MKKACIVLPTYNEADNITPLINNIFAIEKNIPGWHLTILVVDDNSPDGTAQKVRELQKKYPRLKLLTGEKKGLGAAYIRGIKHAMKTIKPDIIFEMDADHSHPPTLIPTFIKTIEEGADIVIGSRYIKGGATPDWGLTRRIISAGGNFFARIIAGLTTIHDCTSGYRALRKEVIKKINLDNLRAKGYSFQMNLLYEAALTGATIKEIPLIFHDRKKGTSKMKLTDLAEFFINALRLRLRTWERFIKFCIVGGTGILINMGVLALITEIIQLPYQLSSIIAIETAILWNFALNDKWTFKKSTNKSSTLTKMIKFHAVSIGGALINWLILIGLTEITGMYYLLSNLIGIATATAWNYLANVKYTWRDEK